MLLLKFSDLRVIVSLQFGDIDIYIKQGNVCKMYFVTFKSLRKFLRLNEYLSVCNVTPTTLMKYIYF
jgi:phage antirepressor YoqD-like protein